MTSAKAWTLADGQILILLPDGTCRYVTLVPGQVGETLEEMALRLERNAAFLRRAGR